MRGLGYWIVVALLLCLCIGSVPAEGPHGELASYTGQGYSGGSSIDLVRGESATSENEDRLVNSASPEEHSSATTLTLEEGIPEDAIASSSPDQGSMSAGSSPAAHERTPGSNDESSPPAGNPGSIAADVIATEDRGQTTAKGDSTPSQGPGNSAGSAGSDDKGAGLATGYISTVVNPNKEAGISRLPGGAENSPLQRGGEWSNAAQETGSPHGSAAYSQDAGRGAGASGSVHWHSTTALSEEDPGTGRNGKPGSMGIMVAWAGSAGLVRSELGGPGGGTVRGDADRDSLPQRQQRGPPETATHYPCGPAETSPVTPAQGQGQTETKEETPSRSRSKRPRDKAGEIEPDGLAPTAPSPPRIPLFPYSLLLFGGYRRISKKNVLEQDARSTLYQAITNNPGIDVPTLARLTGLNENTLRYHLVKLIANGKVTYLVKPGVIRYFLNQGAYKPYEQVFIHYLWSETPREILRLLRRTPGLTRQQISDSLGISGPSVTRQMDHLKEDRLIENRFPGRSNHYYLTHEAVTIFELVVSRTCGVWGSEESCQPLSACLEEVAPEPPAV